MAKRQKAAPTAPGLEQLAELEKLSRADDEGLEGFTSRDYAAYRGLREGTASKRLAEMRREGIVKKVGLRQTFYPDGERAGSVILYQVVKG